MLMMNPFAFNLKESTFQNVRLEKCHVYDSPNQVLINQEITNQRFQVLANQENQKGFYCAFSKGVINIINVD